MEKEPEKKPQEEALDNVEVTELEDEALEGAAGGVLADTNCGCGDTNCGCGAEQN